MKTYIKPTIKVRILKTKETMLAASLEMGTSSDPATEHAMSKSFFDMGATTESPTSSSTSTNVWEEE